MDKAVPTILEVMQDKQLLGGEFSGRSWKAWRTFLAAVYGLRIRGKGLELYRQSTGREKPPTRQCREVFCVAGRRAGKSMISALIAVYTACFRDYTAVLSKGEVAVCMVIAADKAQARVVMGYIKGLLQSVPLLSKLVLKYRAEAVELRGRVRIEVHSSSFRSVRGYSIACVIMDELSFWRSDESANPDYEVARAIRPALATIPGAMLVGISSPYSRRGLLWREYSNHWAQDSDTLIWRAPTLSMNPTIDRAVIDKAFESDAVAAESEWNAEFRSDLESYISLEAVESVTELGRLELPRLRGVQYSSFCDPSGGAAGGDDLRRGKSAS